MPKTYPEHIEKTMPRSGEECTCGAAYHNAMIGRAPTPYADYADMLRKRNGPGDRRLALMIEQHHGEQRRLKFWDFFPAAGRLYRIDDRTTAPLEGWKLDQDRRMKEDVRHYDEWGIWHDYGAGPIDLGRISRPLW